jgi:CRP-like cAMP-binding protein
MEIALESEARIRAGQHWLFTGMAPWQAARLLDAGREARFEAGETVFRQGEPADCLYVLVGGAVRLWSAAESGELVLSVARAGDIFGEMGVLDGQPRSATATASSFSVTYVLPAEPFLDALQVSNLVCMKMLAHMTQRLRVANGRLGESPATGVLPSEPDRTDDPWPISI